MLFVHLHSSPLVIRSKNNNDKEQIIETSSPVDIIDVKQERKLLLQCLKESGKNITWRSEVADPHTFRKAVSYGCRALHFSGHGIHGKIIFENGKCEASLLSDKELTSLLLAGVGKDSEMPLQLVFVSACHSESVAQAFVDVGVAHVVVIAQEDKVLDKKALEFSKAFYTALLIGHSVLESFNIGQTQADICIPKGNPRFRSGNATFKLLGKGDHSQRPFADLDSSDKFIDKTPPLPKNDCDSVAEFFVGRSIEVHKVYTSLVEGARLVSLIGPRGIGKTQIALQTSQYATDRYLFQHIYFIRFEQRQSDADQFRQLNLKDETIETEVFNQFICCFRLNSTLCTTVTALAELVRQKCQEGNFLLILDGCERVNAVDQNSSRSFKSIISELLRRVPTLSILLTTISPIGSTECVGERLISIGRLPPIDAAMLLTVRAPRRLHQEEMGDKLELSSLAENPVLRAIGGHPKVICLLAEELQEKHLIRNQSELLDIVLPSLARFTPEVVRNRPGRASTATSASDQPTSSALGTPATHIENSAPPGTPVFSASYSDSTTDSLQTGDADHMRLLSIADRVNDVIQHREGCMIWAQSVQLYKEYSSSSSLSYSNSNQVPFDYLKQPLCRYFATVLQGDAVQRPLSSRSVEFFRQSRQIWGGGGLSPSQTAKSLVSAEMFASFWKWIDALLPCIRATGLWGYTTPRRIHGFMSKIDAQSLLQGSEVGTFLLRFSESRLKCIAVAYVRESRTTGKSQIEFVQIDYRDELGFQLIVDGKPVIFPTLQQLIKSISVLKCLFPNIPKQEAFGF